MSRHWRQPSIFVYTFVLMMLALGIAEAIGVALMLSKPPVHNAPVSLSSLARRLNAQADQLLPQGRQGRPGPPPLAQQGTASDSFGKPGNAPPGPPGPPGLRDQAPPLPPGPPPSVLFASPSPEAEIEVSEQDTAPTAMQAYDADLSRQVRDQLAMLLGRDVADVLAFVPAGALRTDSMPGLVDASLTEGYVVAVRLSGGRASLLPRASSDPASAPEAAASPVPTERWRVIRSVSDSFPTRFQVQAAELFALGLLVLLPLAWWFARSLSAPVAGFSRAARRLSADLNAAPLSAGGPAEMREAVDSFNTMQARLQSLVRERTHMIASIAHDLRTPLARLAFRVDDLSSPLREKMEGDLSEMKAMITGALEFIRQRSVSSVRERLDFRLLVESVVDDQSDLRRDVQLEPGSPVTISGDSLALRRAVSNVIENAIKYGQRAQLRLTISAGHCQLDVEDQGPGIDPSCHEQVFEPFFRMESARSSNTSGIGLGLATVRAIIVEHGGRVQLENLRPCGLRVRIRLPLSS